MIYIVLIRLFLMLFICSCIVLLISRIIKLIRDEEMHNKIKAKKEFERDIEAVAEKLKNLK